MITYGLQANANTKRLVLKKHLIIKWIQNQQPSIDK